MKICFLADKNINRGSYRIWVNDLNYYIKHLGYISEINPKYIDKFNIVILDKNMLDKSSIIKLKYPSKKIIGINPSAEKKKYHNFIDFYIVGSIVEKNSLLKYHKKIFIIPLIEKMYSNSKKKEHVKKNEIVVGYHGNSVHLNSLQYGCKQALERISKKKPIKLLIFKSSIADNNLWKKGIPNIKIEYKTWNIKTICNDLLNIDIGIVPYINEIKNKLDHKPNIGKYSTDYFIRFKQKANSGRCLVFHQLKIPVIADIIPQNMYLLSNPNNGYAVCGEESWYKAFEELLCEKRRHFIAENAFKEFQEKYDPLKWVQIFLNELDKNL